MSQRINNPLRPCNTTETHFPDPHAKVFINPDTGNECMYVYVGRDFGSTGFDLRDWYVLCSEDLLHWTCKKTLDRKNTYLADDSTECWACDVVQSPWDGRYYLYYSEGGNSIGVAVSDRPDGPFRDAHGMKPLVPRGMTPTNSYDPDVILPDDQDGRAWIVFGSDWTDHYWALQLDPCMTEVLPDTAQKVPVWPSADQPAELLGELRSDQAEAFRYGDTWYLYWAGRYATSAHRLGPYVFRGNIGADIPHYSDGRAFIDHGSFVEWRGQWFYTVSQGLTDWWFRESYMMYLHVCDDGTLMFDEAIRRFGVGCYNSAWERIEAEWYMAKEPGLEKIELRQNGAHQGFAVQCRRDSHSLTFPHVYNLTGASGLTLCFQAQQGASITVLADGAPLAEAPLPPSDGFTCITLPIAPVQDEMTLSFVLSGGLTLDWFSFVR